jgi:hypothetical protein
MGTDGVEVNAPGGKLGGGRCGVVRRRGGVVRGPGGAVGWRRQPGNQEMRWRWPRLVSSGRVRGVL